MGAGLALHSMAPGLLKAEGTARSLGIQLYTVSAAMNTDPHGTLEQIAKIGYKEAETAGFAKLSAADFRKALDAAGLQCPSAHLGFSAADPEPLFADAHAVGAHYVVSSVLIAKAPTPSAQSSKEDIQNFVHALSDVNAGRLQAHGGAGQQNWREGEAGGLAVCLPQSQLRI